MKKNALLILAVVISVFCMVPHFALASSANDESEERISAEDAGDENSNNIGLEDESSVAKEEPSSGAADESGDPLTSKEEETLPPIKSDEDDSTDSETGTDTTEDKDVSDTTIKSEETAIKEIAVSDIEIDDYDESVTVGNTISLSAHIVPINATAQTITFQSSDKSIASVSSTGTVKGISAGTVGITLSAGGYEKTIWISVVVKATTIQLNKNYVVLKPDDSFYLSASVLPADATDQNVTFKSLDTDVAVVSSEGWVTAVDCGTTTIVVSNPDCVAAVTVIVNWNTATTSDGSDVLNATDDTSKNEKVYPLDVSVDNCPIVDSEMLRFLYETNSVLTVRGNGYSIKIDGQDVKNFENTFKTDIMMSEVENGVSFIINNGDNLCGKITLHMNQQGKYLYLYSESKKSYQLIRTSQGAELLITTEGTYLYTNEKLNDFSVLWWILGGSGCVVFVLACVYVAVKKKYWFW